MPTDPRLTRPTIADMADRMLSLEKRCARLRRMGVDGPVLDRARRELTALEHQWAKESKLAI